MKKTIYRLSVVAAALAAVLLTAQCAKEIDPAAESKSQDSIGDGIEVTLTATKGEDTRAELTDETTKVSVTWSEGDKIYVVGENDGLRGSLTLSSGAGSTSASFKGCIKYLTEKQNVRFYYAGKGKEITGDTFDLSIATQYGTLDGIEPMHVMCGTLNNVSPSTLNFGTVTMTNMIAIGKFDIINCTGFTYGSKAELSGAVSSATLDLKSGEWTNHAEGDITLKENLTENYFVALIPSDSKQTLTFSQENKITPKTLAAKVITAGKEYMSTGIDGELDNPIEIGLYPYYDEDNKFQGYGRILGDVVWAPVNCGFDTTNFRYGKLYQYNRVDGSGYVTSAYADAGGLIQTATKATWDSDGYNKKPSSSRFYFVKSKSDGGTGQPFDWYTSNNTSSKLLTWSASRTNYRVGNPCPDGWRVPSKDEITSLLNNTTTSTQTSVWMTFDGQSGRAFYTNTVKAGPKLFLPAAGRRENSTGECDTRGSRGMYWSSTRYSTKSTESFWKIWHLAIVPDGLSFGDAQRVWGFSVRCVRLPGTDVSTTLPGMENSDVTW